MCTSSAISALILRSLSRKVSKVWMIPPSVVFSTGTTPKSALPRSTSSNTAGDRPDGRRARRQAELLLDRHVREGPLGAEVGDAHALLQRQAGAEDLLEHRADRLGRERARVGGRQAIGDLALARRDVERDLEAVFRSATRRTGLGALVEQRQDLVVGARRSWRAARPSSRFSSSGSTGRLLGHGRELTTLACVRLATLRDGTRDGALLVVGRDGRTLRARRGRSRPRCRPRSTTGRAQRPRWRRWRRGSTPEPWPPSRSTRRGSVRRCRAPTSGSTGRRS